MWAPDFIVLGVQKAGTTSLHRYLRAQSGISVPDKKEICFFDLHYDKGLEWYRNQLPNGDSNEIVGEVSPNYFTHEASAKRLASLAGRPQFVVLLRDPIQRAVSNYRFNVQRGAQDPSVSFREAVVCNEGLRRYVYQGNYAAHLERFVSCIDRGRLYIAMYEDLFDGARQGQLLGDILSHIGYEGTPSGVVPHANRTSEVRRGTVPSTLFRLRGPLQSALPAETWFGDRLRRTAPWKAARRLLHRGMSVGSTLDLTVPEWLVEYYAESNRRLRHQFGLELPRSWA